MPSTMLNIMDLVGDYKQVAGPPSPHTGQVVKNNDDISYFYILYQAILLVSTFIGPGSIVLMLVGAFSMAFGLSNVNSLIFNVVLVGVFVISCIFLKSNQQIMVAQLLTLLYAVIMIAVYIGIIIQITEEGPLALSSLMFFFTFGSFFVAALLHPQVGPVPLLPPPCCPGVLVPALPPDLPVHHPLHVRHPLLPQVPAPRHLRLVQPERRVLGDQGGPQVRRGPGCRGRKQGAINF